MAKEYKLPKEYTQIKSVEINGMKVSSEVVNTTKEFKWRIFSGQEVSEWTSHYAGVLVHKFKNGRTFAYASQYWEGAEHSLPIEIPFEIIKG